MRTRVIILLSSPAGYMSIYHNTREDADLFVWEWTVSQKKRIESGDLSVEYNLYSGAGWAILAAHVVGMYIADDKPQAADRIASALEKTVDSGDEWKG